MDPREDVQRDDNDCVAAGAEDASNAAESDATEAFTSRLAALFLEQALAKRKRSDIDGPDHRSDSPSVM